MQSGYFFLVWACAGYLCLFQREINIFVQKEKKDPHRFRDGFFGQEISVQVSDGKRKWSSRMASRRFRVTYSTDRNIFTIRILEWYFYRHMHRKWANKSFIQYDSYTLWMIVNIKKGLYNQTWWRWVTYFGPTTNLNGTTTGK